MQSSVWSREKFYLRGTRFTAFYHKDTGTRRLCLNGADRYLASYDCGFGSVDDAQDAVLQDGGIEVQDQADAQLGQFQAGQQLDFMDGQDLLDGSDLDHDRLLDDQVDAVGVFERDALVDDGQFDLLVG